MDICSLPVHGFTSKLADRVATIAELQGFDSREQNGVGRSAQVCITYVDQPIAIFHPLNDVAGRATVQDQRIVASASDNRVGGLKRDGGHKYISPDNHMQPNAAAIFRSVISRRRANACETQIFSGFQA